MESVEGAMMNRRLFAVGMAAMIPATVAGQDATPTTSAAEATLRYLLSDVIEGGDYIGLADVSGNVDTNTLIENMTQVHRYAKGGVDVQMLASDGEQAMAFAIIADTSRTDYSLFLHISMASDGTLDSYSWCLTGRD